MFHAEHSKYVRNSSNDQIVKQYSHLVYVHIDVLGAYKVRSVPAGK